ncbi:MAG: HAMP domain-containing sensor histidine kinase, partial [Candidatus Omnitrophica bacterium]|nr:HAMP domain-containing sensor histidine kinase [Candidatus Omnitrophota bacterium]
NNPLNGVLNNTQLVKMIADRKKEFSFDEFREYIDAVEKSAVRCKDITRALLEFSHTSADTFKAISLNELIESVITLVRRELELQSIEVRTRFAEKLPLAYGNPQLIQQAIFNLVSNGAWAIRKKNSPEGGVITISTFESEATRGAGFSVADTGIGISKEHMDNLFTPFFTTKDVGEGTGLGLSIVYNIVKDHRGKITAQSKEGEGTVFTVSLPLHDAAPDKG